MSGTVPSSTEPDHVLRVEKNRNYKTFSLYPIVDDTRLSWKAKGILTYLLSRPDGWQFKVWEIEKHAADGEDANRTALVELEEAGYLKRTRTRNPDGTFGRYHWTISEVPKPQWAAEPQDIPPDGIFRSGSSTSGLSSPENPASSNKDCSSQDSDNSDDQTPQARERAGEAVEHEKETEGESEGGEGREDAVKMLTADQRREAEHARRVAWCDQATGYEGVGPDRFLAQWAGLLNRGYDHDRVLAGVLGLAKMRDDYHDRVDGWIEPGDPFNPNVLLTDVRGERLIEVAASYFHKHGAPHTGDSDKQSRTPPLETYRCMSCGAETVNPDGARCCGDQSFQKAS